ncbi:MAG: ActS/PrrB/RegB family redox-sensitive histidine kinase [Alphaproteobacteria bacterium]|jgi:two-component system sensor histidine kinase RegB|nr:ActS/PrrB/RegB family redox-sensitive histidine kinase [Alphaproteobacteria bacterium]
MTGEAGLEPPALQGRVGAIRQQTLILIRWVAITGQSLAVLFIHYGLRFDLPLFPVFATIGASVVFNGFVFLASPLSTRLTDRGAAVSLAFDLVQLTLLLFLTGGLTNPFSLLLLVPVAISASALGLRSTAVIGVMTLSAISLLAVAHFPLPWHEGGIDLPILYKYGLWAALMLGALFVTGYAWQVAVEGRRLQAALEAAQYALAREQRLAALGALAAAAAHELGTPLGTIQLVVKELLADAPPDSDHAEDLQLLASQTRRCREILARLSRRPDANAEGAEPFNELPFPALVEAAAEPHLLPGIQVDVLPKGEPPAPIVVRRPEIIHGLGNIVENAIDFARQRVAVHVMWTRDELRVEVLDDGPGFNVDVLSALGEPYTTTRPGQGMGLGVFIAKTLIEMSGGRAAFFNRPAGGAGVALTWPRAALAVTPRNPAQ